MTEAGPLDEINDDSSSDREDISLPGVLKGNAKTIFLFRATQRWRRF